MKYFLFAQFSFNALSHRARQKRENWELVVEDRSSRSSNGWLDSNTVDYSKIRLLKKSWMWKSKLALPLQLQNRIADLCMAFKHRLLLGNILLQTLVVINSESYQRLFLSFCTQLSANCSGAVWLESEQFLCLTFTQRTMTNRKIERRDERGFALNDVLTKSIEILFPIKKNSSHCQKLQSTKLYKQLCHWFCSQNLRLLSGTAFTHDCR